MVRALFQSSHGGKTKNKRRRKVIQGKEGRKRGEKDRKREKKNPTCKLKLLYR